MRTAKYCQGNSIIPSFAANSISFSAIWQACLTTSVLSGVASPITLTARPGPGNGCLCETETSRYSAKLLTSSLYNSLIGSQRTISISSGKPPTL